MRLKFALVMVVAIAFSTAALADITVNFSSPVSMVSFYSSEPGPLTLTDNNGVTVTVTSGYTFGAITPFSDTGVTSLDFSGTPDFYVLDNLVYSVAGINHTLTFDETTLQNCNCSVGGFYASLPGGPVFSNNADILTYPNYNYGGYPYLSAPDVVYEGGTEPSPTPEPGTLVMLGSGILGLAGMARRKMML
jgi:PEP-CTERM motif